MPNTLAQTRLTRFPVVELPAPGTSYNPTHQDHQSLLREALEQEFRRKKKEEKVERWYNGLGNMNHVERQVCMSITPAYHLRHHFPRPMYVRIHNRRLGKNMKRVDLNTTFLDWCSLEIAIDVTFI